jgi:hypothetical protein
MPGIKTKLTLALITAGAFFGPFAAIVAVENAKRVQKFSSEQEAYAAMKRETEAARYQYYLDLAERKNNLRQSMADAKAQYEQLLKDQPSLVKANQKTVTKTTLEPTVTKKVVEVPTTSKSSSSSSSSSSTPKTSTSTKSS